MNKSIDFLTPITHVQGFRGNRGTALIHENICTTGDLLAHTPDYFIDFSTISSIDEFNKTPHSPLSISGIILDISFPKSSKMIAVTIQDTSGITTVETEIVGNLRDFKIGTAVKACRLGTNQFEFHSNKSESLAQMVYVPRYRLTEQMVHAGITQQFMVESLHKILHSIGSFPERLPRNIEERYRFPTLHSALCEIHFPKCSTYHHLSHFRLNYERNYQIAIVLRWNKKNYNLPGIVQNGEQLQQSLREILPLNFPMEYESAYTQIIGQMNSPKRLHHLIQSEMGNEKNTVAIMSSLAAIGSKNQVVWICRNDRAALLQHKKISSILSSIQITPELLIDSTSVPQRRRLIRSLKTGETYYIILSKSQLTNSLGFHRPGLFVLDHPDSYHPQFRTELQRKGPSADLIVLRDHPLTAIDHAMVCSDLEIIEIQDSTSKTTPQNRIVPRSRKGELFNFLKEKISQGESLLCLIPPKATSSKVSNHTTTMINMIQRIDKYFDSEQIIIACKKDQTPEEQDAQATLLTSEKPKIFVCTDERDLPVEMPAVSLALVINSDRMTSGEISAIQHDYLIQNESSWLFCLNEIEKQNRCDDSSALQLFHQVYHDLETTLIPE